MSCRNIIFYYNNRPGRMNLPRNRSSRRLLCGAVLIALPSLAVSVAKRGQKPWIAGAPAYRQEGSPDAKVVLVEFSDFQCPSCAASVQTIHQLLALHGSDMRLIFKYYPWSFHRWARKTAIAAECAGRQGRFWPMHDVLFSNQALWDRVGDEGEMDRLLDSYARSAGANLADLHACQAGPEAAAAVDADLKEGQDHWVNSTPTFFVNGERFSGALQLRTFGLNKMERLLRP